jgi:hypothetical protein
LDENMQGYQKFGHQSKYLYLKKKKKSKVMETMDSEPNIKILNKDGVQLCPFMTFPHLSHSHPGSGSNKTLFIKARA